MPTPLTKQLLHTTDVYIKKLAKAGVSTVEEMIGHYPRTYENRTNILEHFSFVNIKEKNSVIATIESITAERTRNGKQLIKAILRDKSDFLCEAVWFNRQFLLRQYHIGDKVVIFGQPKYDYGKLSFLSPDIDFYNDKSARFEPVYPELNYIPSSWFVSKMPLLKGYFKTITNILPENIRLKKWFRNKHENLISIHFPKDEADFKRARDELAYEELFTLQYEGIKKKHAAEAESTGKALPILLDAELVKDILERLPFPLTNHQKIATFQILKDMERNFAMNRLLQGDVGTGKTAVALIAAIHAILKSWGKSLARHSELVSESPDNRSWDPASSAGWHSSIQVAFMVPTEILARQHFASIQELLSHYNISSDLLVGSLGAKQKKEAQARLKSGQTQVIVGTHALIQDDVHFQNLAFVIIDEQHRFGVEQRKALEQYANFIPPVKGGEGGLVSQDKIPIIPYEPNLLKKSQELRKNMPEPEKQMWFKILSRKQFEDLKFTRQKPLLSYIVDFYCAELRLAIEIDGDSHSENVDYDEKRTRDLWQYDIRVIRYTNNEIIENIEWVYEDLYQKIEIRRQEILNPPTPLHRGAIAAAPHVLHMTATPIPRTLALTIYGDQDISTISEYPVWRKPIHTKVIKEHERDQVYRFIEEEVRNGHQVYWISPLVEESETLDISSAVSMFENLEAQFPHLHVGLLHGKMKGKEKDEVMQKFLAGVNPRTVKKINLEYPPVKGGAGGLENPSNLGNPTLNPLDPPSQGEISDTIDILSSTSVVEVGVNNPNATIICIEAAERFGLSQLHQFRGRVGRGHDQSYCYLFTTKAYTGERLRAMEQTNNGFELAEIDLELRGPGEVYGVRQSGIPDFKIANLKDFELISEIREDIEEFMKK